ncbi:VWA domain-containing protein [Candidatus Bipolaricaulota bacterium]|nr:VWA domain-containing protein [Candidatus Bipolaricaulota bacterium]
MRFGNPAAFYFLLGALLILLLHFLRSRERRREVSTLFLWEGLPGDPQSKAAQFRQHIDPLLLLQLGILTALTLALAQPVLPISQRSVSGLAIVIDGSTSMRTQTEDGTTRYQQAIEQAATTLAEYTAEKTVLIQFSEHPQLLAHPKEASDLEAILRDSSPTWFGDGTTEDLVTMMGSVGGVDQFERIVVLSDHPLEGLPPHADLILFNEGDNVGITAFSVRQNVTDYGISAFVEVLNDTAGYVDTAVRISDGENQTTLSLMLAPGSIEQYTIPFPNSRGSVFTATLEHPDALDADNQRFFALERPIDVRVYWIGERNRYIIAALRASVPVTEVKDIAQADLVIVNQTPVPSIEKGVVLLIQSSMEGVLTLGQARTAGDIIASEPNHPLLRSMDASDFRIRQIVEGQFEVPYTALLETDGVPVLAEVHDSSRRLFFLMADLMNTNLPVTVDFPIFIRNLVNELVRIPAELSFEAPEVGDFITLQGRGTIQSLTDAQDRPQAYSEALMTFAPPEPGVYTLRTDKGAFALTVNIPASETVLRTNEPIAASTQAFIERSERLYPLWPILLAMAVLLLIAESFLHLGLSLPLRRSS